MKWILILSMSFLLLAGCASQEEVQQHPSGLVVSEIKPDKLTALSKHNLLNLAQVYDLSPILFTRKVQIQSNVPTVSHPVMTLDTHNAEYPNRLLSQFIREELQWWVHINQVEVEVLIKELMKIYPKVPVAKNAKPHNTYLQLIVNYLELRAMTYYVGAKEARKVLTYKMQKEKSYPWVYTQVLNKNADLKRLIEKHRLVPEPF